MAIYTTYDTVGIKEDVSDVISNLTPTKTPFQTMIGSDKTKNKRFQWLEDSLRAVGANAQVEGFTATAATLTPPVERENVTQILEKTFIVSGTEDAMDQYGRAKETAYQTTIAGEELKRDLEHAMIGVDQAQVNGDTVTARKMASASQQIAAAVTHDAALAALDESMLLDVAQKSYDNGAEPTIFMIKPADSLIVAGFTGSAGRTRTFNDGTKTVTNAVDIYVSPFGTFKVVLNRFILSSDALLLDPDMWQKVTLRNWTRETLAKDGDNTKTMLLGEFSLKHKNYLGSGRIKNLA